MGGIELMDVSSSEVDQLGATNQIYVE